MTQLLSPTQANKRIDILDIVRGFALIGILLMNIEWFSRPMAELMQLDLAATGADYSAGWLVKTFVEGKFIKLFSLLFGMGFALMLLKAKAVGRPFGAWFTRRMLVLLLFGFAHWVFLWGGDILHGYAFAGLLLLALVMALGTKLLQRFNHPVTILRIGLVMICMPFALSIFQETKLGVTRDYMQTSSEWAQEEVISSAVEMLRNPVEGDERQLTSLYFAMSVAQQRLDDEKEAQAFVDLDREIFTQGSYWKATEFRLIEMLSYLTSPTLYTGIAYHAAFTLPLLLVGYWFIASGVLREPKKHRLLFKQMAFLGTSFGLILNIVGVNLSVHPAIQNADAIHEMAYTLSSLGQYALTAGYLGLMVLAIQTDYGRRRLSWLVPMGQMALTNYIMHSLILAVIFHGYAGQMYGLISRAPQMLIVVAIILFQAIASTLWLKKFRFGPLEWLWRSLTYLKVQPMQR
ncbi:MAG: DUF418 domain-containing protein [Algicola sp.]|nr:DUF418 domain-containing protein [Algicola sp.]